MIGVALWACAVTVTVYLIACAPSKDEPTSVKVGWFAAMLLASLVSLLGAFVVR